MSNTPQLPQMKNVKIDPSRDVIASIAFYIVSFLVTQFPQLGDYQDDLFWIFVMVGSGVLANEKLGVGYLIKAVAGRVLTTYSKQLAQGAGAILSVGERSVEVATNTQIPDEIRIKLVDTLNETFKGIGVVFTAALEVQSPVADAEPEEAQYGSG